MTEQKTDPLEGLAVQQKVAVKQEQQQEQQGTVSLGEASTDQLAFAINQQEELIQSQDAQIQELQQAKANATAKLNWIQGAHDRSKACDEKILRMAQTAGANKEEKKKNIPKEPHVPAPPPARAPGPPVIPRDGNGMVEASASTGQVVQKHAGSAPLKR